MTTVDLVMLAAAVEDAPELLRVAAELAEDERVRKAHIEDVLDELKRILDRARRGKGEE